MLDVRILGTPPNDNALLVTADGGQSRSRLLFDCGADTLAALSPGEIRAIDHLFLSHLHMDHITGFDAFFRMNFQRGEVENHIWGPPGTARILHHRFQGFWWNHASELSATWHVHDIGEAAVRTFRFEAHEAFTVMHEGPCRKLEGPVLTTPEASVTALSLRHHGTSLGYVVREPDRTAVDMAAVKALGLVPGPWLAALKDPGVRAVMIGGTERDAAALREQVITAMPGDCAAYMTDFRADAGERARLAPLLAGVGTLYAEAQYTPEDIELARRYDHSTVTEIAELARMAGVGCYTLLHLSRRYSPAQWRAMRDAACAVFPQSRFIPEWGLD